MIYVFGGLLLAIAYTTLALALAIWNVDITPFGDILISCHVSALEPSECRKLAINAGWETALGLLAGLLCLVTFQLSRDARHRYQAWRIPSYTFQRSFLYQLFMLFIILLVAIHLFYRFDGPMIVNRTMMLSHESRFASLENLCWPILLQLFVADKSRTGRYLALVLLVTIASLTFYRAMYIALLVFGVGLFALEIMHRCWRHRARWRKYVYALGEHSLVGLVLVILIFATAVSDSSMRRSYVKSESADSPVARVTEQPVVEDHSGQRRMVQRIMFPLYQASMAKQISLSTELPSATQTIARKFRLSGEPNLNEFLYRSLYEYDPVGQAVSLFYGEAAASTALRPFYWILASCIILISVAIVGQRIAVPIGLVVGVALWRGYQGGLFDILPALIIQLVTIIAITSPRFFLYLNRVH
ncbi:MAG: hypothetical protein OEN02_11100 [Gammaproteobacteria bacterium]|nr:hypothetical protein [Gammaproteobacteria bacterium]MDH3535698.1 hypothetical protein [Gammaproteobacteria bacterium]